MGPDQLESRSVQRRIALQKGEPIPEFSNAPGSGIASEAYASYHCTFCDGHHHEDTCPNRCVATPAHQPAPVAAGATYDYIFPPGECSDPACGCHAENKLRALAASVPPPAQPLSSPIEPREKEKQGWTPSAKDIMDLEEKFNAHILATDRNHKGPATPDQVSPPQASSEVREATLRGLRTTTRILLIKENGGPGTQYLTDVLALIDDALAPSRQGAKK